MFGPEGIAWKTTDLVAPGDSVQGFRFKTASDYPVEDYGLIAYESTEEDGGVYLLARGPVARLPESVSDHDRRGSESYRLCGSPNPATSGLRIHLTAPHAGFVRLQVFDTTGRLVRRLVEAEMGEGEHLIPWDGKDDRGHTCASGAYNCRLEAGGVRLSKRLILLR